MVLLFSRNKYKVKGHIDNNFSLCGGCILRIITKYLNAHLKYKFLSIWLQQTIWFDDTAIHSWL